MLIHGNEQVTEYAARHTRKLEEAGYLHSSYERFKEISNYNSMINNAKLKVLGDKIIEKQQAREEQIYKILKVSGPKELNEKYLSDEGVQNFIMGSFNNIYATIADALTEVLGSSNLNVNVSKTNQKKIANSIEKTFANALDNLSDEYTQNLNKLVNNGTISLEMASSIKDIDNRTKDNHLRKASEIAKSSLAQWKGKLGEIAIGLFASQLNQVDGVKVTGGDIDELGKFIKSDVTTYRDDMNIGFSVKNYKVNIDKNGDKVLPREIALHSGGNFATFLKRIESLNAGELQGEINDIASAFSSDNYYYNLINEAVEKTRFKTSDPAMDFINTLKAMAAAWFGTQLIINQQNGMAGQNVDFFVISNYGIIPMSVLLKALKTQSADLKVSIRSTTNLDEEELYEKKINEYYNPKEGLYNRSVLNIGHYAGEEVYAGIKVSEIKLSLILSKMEI